MRYLGLDLGTRSLGIAVSDKTGIVASFYKNIKYVDENKLLDELVEIIKSLNIGFIVLGYPKNMDNSEGFRAQETRLFMDRLNKLITIPIALQDERLTTKVAEDVLIGANVSRKKRKKVIDGVSAVVILQSYLDRKDRV